MDTVFVTLLLICYFAIVCFENYQAGKPFNLFKGTVALLLAVAFILGSIRLA